MASDISRRPGHGKRVAVVAVGGNSLIKDHARRSFQDQQEVVRETCEHVAGMIEAGWSVVLTHGNGPQVGFVLRQSELAAGEVPELPLDAGVASTQGTIGYMLQQGLYNEFRARGMARQAVTVVTQVLVDRNDTEFQRPTKPIGSFVDEATARRRRQEGWKVVEDSGRGWRRVVASPRPRAIVEQAAIEALLAQDFVVVAAGGGGIPVVGAGELAGVAAVIDKDLASSLLACGIHADLFLISTTVEKVAVNFGKPDQRWLDRMTVAEAKAYTAAGEFKAGSMLPKIRAVILFLERGGKEAIITTPDNIERALAGETGTRIVP